jgi:hypothetical protein
VYLVKDSYRQADDDKCCRFATITVFYRNKCSEVIRHRHQRSRNKVTAYF